MRVEHLHPAFDLREARRIRYSMSKTTRIALKLAGASLLIASHLTFAQLQATADIIELKDGRRIEGKIIQENEKKITVESAVGGGTAEFSIERGKIQSVTREPEREEQQKYWKSIRQFIRQLQRRMPIEQKSLLQNMLRRQVWNVKQLISY